MYVSTCMPWVCTTRQFNIFDIHTVDIWLFVENWMDFQREFWIKAMMILFAAAVLLCVICYHQNFMVILCNGVHKMIYYHLFISNIIHFCMNLIGYMIFFGNNLLHLVNSICTAILLQQILCKIVSWSCTI